MVSDQASGDVTVLLNDPAHSFSQQLRFNAGTEPSTLDAYFRRSSPGAQSTLPVSVVAGDFLGNGQTDLVVVDRGTHSFTVLPGDGHGGFLDPELALTTSTSDGLDINNEPGPMVAGDFNRDGTLDLAVLMEDTGQVWIYTGVGNGTFRHTFSIAVGDQATGLSVVPGNGPGLLNLVVGNSFGDVLILEGKGDGTFQIQGNRVSMSVVPDLLGPGQAGVLVGDQQNDRVTVQAPIGERQPVRDRGDAGQRVVAVRAVGARRRSSGRSSTKGSPLPDAIVVSTGSNAVVVYRTTSITGWRAHVRPAAETYFVGTAPVSVTVADFNGNGIPCHVGRQPGEQ